MINAAAIIAKITIFIVEKSVGQIISLPIDKRRKACRSLTKLYYSIQSLDDTTEFFLETFKDFQDRGEASAFISSVAAHSRDITLSSNVFIELGQELIGGLEIIDPVLANCCHTLYVGKFDFLTYISKSIEWDHSGELPSVVLKRPLGKMEKVDMEAMYSETKNALADGETFYWPESALDHYHDEFVNVTITFDDEKVATELRQMIADQNKNLKNAKELLRNLLKDNFSVEEILFQSESHPKR